MNAAPPVETLITDHLDLWTTALKRKSSAGRGSSSKVELYGIKKLRELILELAVRGLLVPQDPNDEPASELLKRIAAEKARLVKAGKIKKGKPLPLIRQQDEPFDLPSGWKWAVLPQICSYGPGKTPSTKNSVYWEDGEAGIAWVSISDMEHLRTITNTAKRITQKAVAEVFRGEPVSAGTMIMSFKLTLGKISKLGVDAYHNEAIISLRPYAGICEDYVFNFLPGRASAGNSKAAIKGNTLNSESLAALLIPIPPSKEQHRIVAKVDELMALCDQLEQRTEASLGAHQTLVETLLSALTSAADHAQFASAWQRIAGHFDTLFTTEESITQLKQTILQLAVMGKLVPQDPNDEPASELLKKIAAKPHKHTLPGWATVSLGQLGDIVGGATPSKSNAEYWTGTIPWVSPKDMKRKLIADAEDHVSEVAISNSSLKKIPPGSLLMVVRGMILAHSFPVAISECEVTINQDMKALVIPPELGAYLLTFMQAMKGAFVALVDRSSHGTCKLVSEKLWSYPVSLPPLAEQHRIVAKVDDLMALCDQLKSRLRDAQTTQLHLANALVERAIC